jgi:hypothetical protein
VFLPVREPAGFVSLNTSSFGTLGAPEVLAIGDFNRDGKQDLAVVRYGDGRDALAILLGNGDGTFQEVASYQLPAQSSWLAATDTNGDGNLDLVMSLTYSGSGALAVLLGNGDGTFKPMVQYPTTSQAFRGVLGDFNRDGAVDAVLIGGDGFYVFLGNGDGTFQSANQVDSPFEAEAITAGDFSGDGKLDLAVVGFSDGVGVMLGNGDGTFQALQTYQAGGTSTSLATADFNGDGKLDIVAANEETGSVAVLLGNGDGSFQTPSAFPTALFPDDVVTADVNGDGKLDLVVSNGGFNATSVSILLGNGDGTFQNHVDYDGSIASGLVTSDFNNDGRLDVAVSNNVPNTIAILTQDNGTVVVLSPEKLSFPTQLLGTVSDPKLITVSNGGSSAIMVSNVSIDANFSQLNNCKTVQPGGSCKIGVYFTPTIDGTLTGYLAIADTGGGSPQIVSLSGVATIVSISPNKLNFGDVKVGSISPSQNVVVTNEGDGAMKLNGVGIVGSDAKDFSEVNACPATLAAGANCTIAVIFHPRAQGARSATLGIEDSGGGSPQTVPLTGTGT